MGNEITKENAEKYVRYMLYAKILALAFVLMVVSVIMIVNFGITDSAAIVPIIFFVMAIAVFLYYLMLDKKHIFTTTTVTVTEKKRDIAASLITKLDISKKKYRMEYISEDGCKNVFYISRSGRLSALEENGVYEVLHRNDKPLDENNFYGCILLREQPEQKEEKGNEI